MKHKGGMKEHEGEMDEVQGGHEGGTRGQWMKHKGGNEGGTSGAMDEVQGVMKGARGSNG